MNREGEVGVNREGELGTCVQKSLHATMFTNERVVSNPLRAESPVAWRFGPRPSIGGDGLGLT